MGWEEMEVDTTDFLQSLEKFSRDPDGSIQGLPENLLAIGRIPSGVGDVHDVEENLHNHLRPRNSRQDMTRATSRRWRKGMERLQARCKLD